MDDLFLAICDRENAGRGKGIASRLSKAGCKVSWQKAQVCQQEVRYFGFIVSEGQFALGPERKQAI
jgi:hypothetical protein